MNPFGEDALERQFAIQQCDRLGVVASYSLDKNRQSGNGDRPLMVNDFEKMSLCLPL